MSDRGSEHHVESAGLTRQELVKRGAVLAAGIGLAGPGAASTASAARRAVPKRKVLRVAYTGANITDVLDPIRQRSYCMYTLCGSLYEPLVAVDDQWRWSGLLADRIESNAAGDLWTFHLKKANFHNGKRLTAADVGYSIARVIDTKSSSSQYFSVLAPILDPSGIQVSPKGNKSVVRFKLKAPNFLFPIRMASKYTEIIPDGTTTEFGIGTGPFMLKSFSAAKSYEVERNPRYRDPSMPGLAGVTGLVVPDQATKVQTVLSGESGLSDPMEYSSIDAARANSNVQILRERSGVYYHIVIDTRAEQFKSNLVRQAIKLAIDRAQMLKVVLHGYGQIAHDVSVARNDPAFPPGLNRKRDLARAKQLLAQAGYPNGFDMKIYTSAVFAGLVDIAVLFAKQMADVGIKVDIQQVPTANYISEYYAKVPAFDVWQFPREPLEMLAFTMTAAASANVSHWTDPRVEQAVAQVGRVKNAKKRAELLHKATKAVADGSGVIVPVLADSLWLANKNLKGMRFDSRAIADWRRATLA